MGSYTEERDKLYNAYKILLENYSEIVVNAYNDFLTNLKNENYSIELKARVAENELSCSHLRIKNYVYNNFPQPETYLGHFFVNGRHYYKIERDVKVSLLVYSKKNFDSLDDLYTDFRKNLK